MEFIIVALRMFIDRTRVNSLLHHPEVHIIEPNLFIQAEDGAAVRIILWRLTVLFNMFGLVNAIHVCAPNPTPILRFFLIVVEVLFLHSVMQRLLHLIVPLYLARLGFHERSLNLLQGLALWKQWLSYGRLRRWCLISVLKDLLQFC